MKTYILPNEGNFYKANLHCHSNISDGNWSVEEIKKYYMEEGYSIVAYTDHDVFVPHNDLTDESFLALNGYEVAINEEEPSVFTAKKTCHLCFIALDPKLDTQKIIYNSRMLDKNTYAVKLAPDAQFIEIEYSVEYINKLIENGKKEGFFISYNHPAWSLEEKEQYCGYKGFDALEIINYASIVEDYADCCPVQYEEMLRAGNFVGCVASDDNHNKHDKGHPFFDSFGGFTYIKAKELTYEAVADALKNGDYYASEGAEIKELWLEDGKVHVLVDEAAYVYLSAGARRKPRAYLEEGGGEAVFELRETDPFFRITVINKNGKRAYTRAYKLENKELAK